MSLFWERAIEKQTYLGVTCMIIHDFAIMMARTFRTLFCIVIMSAFCCSIANKVWNLWSDRIDEPYVISKLHNSRPTFST